MPHRLCPPLIDFKANVLVSGNQSAVICDFGSAHITSTLRSSGISSEMTQARGTSRWMAYELLAEAEKYPLASKASDTWSFGMTVYASRISTFFNEKDLLTSGLAGNIDERVSVLSY